MKITRKIYVLPITVLFIAFLLRPLSGAQSPDDIARGIQLYSDGKMKEAISVLGQAVKKQKDNPDAWHILGLAQYKIGDVKSALKSFETSIKLRPNSAPAHTNLSVILYSLGKMSEAGREAEQAIKLDPQSLDAYFVLGEVQLCEDKPAEALKAADAALQLNSHFAMASLLKGVAWLRLFEQQTNPRNHRSHSESDELANGQGEDYQRYKLLSDAAVSLEAYLKFSPENPQKDFWREQWEAARFYSEWAEKKKNTDSPPFSMKQSLRPTITYKERAKYTDEARSAGVKGNCILKVEFADDGKVKHILVLQGLSHGLTQQVVYAASKMRFTPAIKDGTPVSVVGNVEFNFSLY